MLKSSKSKLSVIFATVLLIAGFFMSCSSQAQSQNISQVLLEVDSLIKLGDSQAALKDLKALEKKVSDSWSVLGIYKRYETLGENKAAEKFLVKYLKKNAKNTELNAVYSKYLISQNRLEEAKKYAENLKNTDYASIYSELIFKTRMSEYAESDIRQFLQDDEYLALFKTSYETSRNPVWLRNSALCYLYKGLYTNAALLSPNGFQNASDAFFWAKVNYDSGNYSQALDCIAAAFVFENSRRSLTETELISLYALESDCWYLDLDSESSEKSRERLLAIYNSYGEVNDSLKSNDILPMVFTNSAIWNLNNGETEKARDLLSAAVFNYPLYVPAVISYANFAYESNLEREEDSETLALRKNGNKTLEMERYDSRPKIPLSDALSRIDHALITTNDPYLYITKLDLRYKTDKSLSNEQKKMDLWKLLEEQSYKTASFSDVLVRYTLSFFLKNKLYDDSYNLFYKYMLKKYKFSREQSLFDQIAASLPMIDIEDSELAFYFALYYKNETQAKRIGEYVCFESSGIRNHNELSPKVTTEAVMNLANYYSSVGRVDDALDLYGKASGREENKIVRSECFYRIAEIYRNENQIKNALRAADYACSLYPDNAKAWLMKTRLTEE